MNRGKRVVSDDAEKFKFYNKPLTRYSTIQIRSQGNPFILPRCLSYRIQAKKQKKSNSSGGAIFNYMDSNNRILKAEHVKGYSCIFCSMKCGSPKGLKLHLTSSHDIFEYNFRLSNNDHPTIDVSMKPIAVEFGELSDALEKKHYWIPFTFRSKRKRGQRNDGLESLELQRNRGAITFTRLEIGQSSKSQAPLRTRRKGKPRAPLPSRRKGKPVKLTKGTSTSLLNKRQFYHSTTGQPMTLEEVMTGEDSESDEELVDMGERWRINTLEEVRDEDKNFMYLWSSFVRTQRVLADSHMPWACEAFSKFYEKDLISSEPFRDQWRQFMVKLWEYGLICANTMHKCNTFLLNSQEAAAAASSSTSQATATRNE
ncbi:unnamed protein product [Thlaspi arvense]|uniref:Polycomb protein VEFS-Box domain-containing protein n=1 Tax=Thlaspi arvense TaxID=13288 RepID=A0AAU9SAJ0_THLAR|nr:unnamed protein product [Thlaspi arvense]